MRKASERAGVRVIFDPSLDGSGWPGPLGARNAVIDECWLGPRGLLARLETELGLGGLRSTTSERAARLAGVLGRVDGFWSESHEADPLGTAERLVEDRDLLMMWGWRGEPVSARLQALAEVTGAVLPGVADRLDAVLREIPHHRPAIASIELALPEALLPTTWRSVLEALRATGIAVREAVPAPTSARGDLGAARGGRFDPVGDGSLTLFRPHGPLAAAEAVAGALAARGSLGGVLLVGADRVLVQALERAGLPRPMIHESPPASVGALRLVVELMFRPADPALVYKLLCLDPGPIPRSLGTRLMRALSELPGRGTTEWHDALERGLEAVDDEPRRDRLRERVTTLLDPIAHRGDAVPVEAVVARMRLLSSWARGVADSSPSTLAVALAADTCVRLLHALPEQHLTWVRLRRLLDETDQTNDVGVPAATAQAGLACVDRPGAVLGPSPVIIWWGFTRDRAPRTRRFRISEAERAAFRDRGITPPDPSARAAAAALSWRRPLEQATDSLVLVCPRRVEAGEKGFPHPLWDELVAAMGGSAGTTRLVTGELTVPAAPVRLPVQLRPLPQAQESWRVGRPIAPRPDGDSPSSLESLLSCSLQWALRYHGRLGLRFSPPPAPGPLLYGSIAHVLIAQIFAGGALAPAAARTAAETLVDAALPLMCETLFLPRYQVEHATLRQAVIESAVELARVIEAMGATIRGVEHALQGVVSGIPLRGVADLLLSNPDSVIDLKWGKTTNRARLKSGTALQLAAYAELARTGPARPQIGYFILRNQELFAEPGTSFPEPTVPGAHQAVDIWRAAIGALIPMRASLAAGELRSPGAVVAEVQGALCGDELTLAPGCGYCDYNALCGRGAAL